MRILMLGVKEYPYGVSAKFESSPGGGTAKYVIALAQGLVKKGHTVDLIVRRMPGQKSFELSKGINIHRVAWINNKYLRLPVFNLMAFFRGLKLAKKSDVIHCHGSFSPFFGLTLGRLYLKRVIGTPHGTTSFAMRYKYGRILTSVVEYLERTTFSRLDSIAFLSEQEEKNICTSLLLTPKKSVIIPPAIRVPKYRPVAKSRKFRIIFVGRIAPVKKIDNLITALALLPTDIRNKVELLILGEGDQKSELVELAKNLKVDHLVKFVGYTTNVFGYLRSSDLFILPSEREGFPCSVLEAMSVGTAIALPALGLPISSLYAMKDNNPKTIAKTVCLFLSQPDLSKKFGSRSQIEFNERFSVDSLVNRHQHLYSDVA
ncbi:MAG: glycosyltransferase family 4 protein [Candidatus Woesearchaeota archaeon]